MRDKRIFPVLFGGSNPFAYRALWLHTIYVATTGNDTTGNGSKATPYLTLTKAMTVVVAGDGILLADGTYAENTSATGYWDINNKAFATWVVIEPEKGATGNVTITAATPSQYYTRLQGTTSYIHFKNLKFDGAYFPVHIGGNVSNVKFSDCATLTVASNTHAGITISGAGYTVTNITFDNFTVRAPSSGASFVGVNIAGHITNYHDIAFNDCTVNGIYQGYNISACGVLTISGGTVTGGSGGGNYISLVNAGAATISSLVATALGATGITCSSAGNVATFTNCTLPGITSFGAGSVTFSGCTMGSIASGTTIAAATPSFINCIAVGTTSVFQSNGITGIIITGGTYTTTGNGNGVLFGVDGTTGNTTTATMTNVTVVHDPTKTGHGVLFGAGCLNCVADGVSIPTAYDYGLVVKENTGMEVKNCTITSGSTAGLCFKAAIGANAHDNAIATPSGSGFLLTVGDTGNKSSTWQFQNNIVNVSGTGKALKIGTATADLGGGICDYNTYQNNSGLGAVRSDTNVANLSELQAAWADYDVTTNDSHSTVV